MCHLSLVWLVMWADRSEGNHDIVGWHAWRWMKFRQWTQMWTSFVFAVLRPLLRCNVHRLFSAAGAISIQPKFFFLLLLFFVVCLILRTLIYLWCDFTAVWLPVRKMMCKLEEGGKQTRQICEFCTNCRNKCFSTEPVISICFVGAGGVKDRWGDKGEDTLYIVQGGGWMTWDFSLSGRGLCNDYL